MTQAPSSCLGFWRRLLVELESPVYLVVSPAIGLVFNVRQLQCEMGCYDRSKNKLKACALCLLLCAANLIEVSEARKVAAGRVTKPTANRGYASPDIAKLSYSPSHQAAAPPKSVAPVASAPSQQAGRPPVGWNVPNNAPPPYSANAGNHGPPPPYSAQANPNLNSRFNEAPPPYASHANPGFQPAPPYQGGAPAFGAPAGVVAGNAYRPHGHNTSAGGFGGGFPPVQPNAGYPVQPAQGFPGAPVAHPGGGYPGGYPQQPVYQSPAGGYPQQPGTVIHHYEQPQSSANPNGDAPLAAAPETPTPETLLATTDPANTSTDPVVPLAAFPVAENASATATSSSSETSAVTVEAPNAALSVQPALSAAAGPTTAPQLSAEPVPTAGKAIATAQFSSFLLLLPALCKFLLS
ncbi:hypothetical protein pipiens_010053 [Culex pipiens pipiens]|uniref:Uncharacterized protein n=1 Tax=Culex pipiens pipiens TaxID=38569 RepID=A0ABD1DBR0_CULPP